MGRTAPQKHSSAAAAATNNKGPLLVNWWLLMMMMALILVLFDKIQFVACCYLLLIRVGKEIIVIRGIHACTLLLVCSTLMSNSAEDVLLLVNKKKTLPGLNTILKPN